ncbi:hypothetical protein H920_12672 [Fukomys damarensis]|uniref:Uncharacterized protein n=1 Tax=Fukomys damarensis TaxID=885580 RepID=A0A091D1F9_FUKDA|nr:hypothetical protein H920_12672 [Fukomys damarensis]
MITSLSPQLDPQLIASASEEERDEKGEFRKTCKCEAKPYIYPTLKNKRGLAAVEHEPGTKFVKLLSCCSSLGFGTCWQDSDIAAHDKWRPNRDLSQKDIEESALRSRALQQEPRLIPAAPAKGQREASEDRGEEPGSQRPGVPKSPHPTLLGVSPHPPPLAPTHSKPRRLHGLAQGAARGHPPHPLTKTRGCGVRIPGIGWGRLQAPERERVDRDEGEEEEEEEEKEGTPTPSLDGCTDSRKAQPAGTHHIH